METTAHIRAILASLPAKPGVYQYYDAQGELLYVGKARSLKNRVSSYFNRQQYESGKTALLVRKIADIRYIVVESEADALLLENSLIKTHKPRYNIAWKDDKSFPSIVIKKEDYPRIYATRQLVRDGSEYHGPFASVKTMHTVLDLARKLYPVRSCPLPLTEKNIAAGKFKVCLEYHLGNCLGPCEGRQSKEEYDAGVEAIRRIIKGRYSEVVREMRTQMEQASAALKFEEAQRIKERIELLENFQSRSTVVSHVVDNLDVFSLAAEDHTVYVNYMHVSSGMVVQGYTTELKKKLDESAAELLEYAVVELRQRFKSQAPEICAPFELNIELPGVTITVPQRGDRRKLLDLSERNARLYMMDARKQLQHLDPERHQQRILQTLQQDLRLKELPVHIECFDNSNIQGTEAVSACVVFKKGKPSKKDYRIFNVRTVDGPDDFATMREAVMRRYKRMIEENTSLPQLIIIDGGKGQLSAALGSLDELGLRGKVAIIGIAKKLEEIFFPGDSVPLYLDKKSESLKLIQHLRNEAHRFGISRHRSKRSKSALHSELLEIPGIGTSAAAHLIKHFGSVKKVKEAGMEELREVLNNRQAGSVYRYFHTT